MSTIEYSRSAPHVIPAYRSLLGTLRATTASLVQRWHDREALRQLKLLSPHLLRDMGFDPKGIYDAKLGTLGEINAHRLMNRPR